MVKASLTHRPDDGHGLCPLPILRLIATTHLGIDLWVLTTEAIALIDQQASRMPRPVRVWAFLTQPASAQPPFPHPPIDGFPLRKHQGVDAIVELVLLHKLQ